MNRTGKCIKMLFLLQKNKRMKASELAIALDTNKRNIREYVKELEVAGFHIDSISGSSGGYELVTDMDHVWKEGERK